MISKYQEFHEEEVILLKSEKPLSLEVLRRNLAKFNFEKIDDFFSLNRTDKVYPWQSIDVVSVKVYNNDRKLDLEDDEPWNILKFEYLFAGIPFHFTDSLFNIIFTLTGNLHLSVEHNSNLYNKDKLLELFNNYKEEVCKVFGDEPGSKTVWVKINSTYPR